MIINTSFDVSMMSSLENSLVTFVNPYSYYIHSGSGLEFDYVYADGISLVWAYNLFHKEKIDRYSFDFTSVAHKVFSSEAIKGLNIALVGGTDRDILQAKDVISGKYPNVSIVYTRSGFFTDAEQKTSMIEDLRKLNLDIIIIGAGTPLQEELLQLCKAGLEFKVGFTCGGFFSQIATNEEYFNPILSKLHLRWLQRFIRHSYVRKRVLIDYPRFFVRFFSDNLASKFK